MLRHGAWYPVVSDLGPRVVVVVKERRVAVPRHLLEFRDRRPNRFTVVYRPRGAENPSYGTPGNLGRIYAVCPKCGSRLSVFGEPKDLVCKPCGHRGEVAWWETG
ncbi:MAG: hypothetical protein HY337_00650 [Gemmatimonadetes bacterium]|nr:hypothetical protein [Gemmatimonadota bacterium]